MNSHSVQMLPGMAEYPRDTWYVGALSSEVSRKPLLREIAGEPVVFYRKEDGTAVALFGRCPHRGMLLDKGPLIGDRLQCGYHGLEYESSGKCVFVPSGGTIPAGMALKPYPLIESHGWIWLWPGDAAKADPALLPDLNDLGFTRSGFFSEPGIYLHVPANYLLPLENLADATHITYLHHGMIDTGNVAAHPYRVEVQGRVVRMLRVFENEQLPEMLAKTFNIKGRVNRTLDLTTYAPGVVLIRIVFAPADDPSAKPAESNLVVAVTPENHKGTHQFSANTGSFLSPHPGRFDDLRNLLTEDVVAISEIQTMFDKLGPQRAPEVSVKSDEGAIRVRRIIAGMIASERNVTASAS